MNRRIRVVCFSGTGNTELVVERIVNVLTSRGIDVYWNHESSINDHFEESELLLAFPVNSQAVSPYIWKYLKSLPDGKGRKVNVVVTLNESAAILTPLRRLLEKKGYVPQGAIEISMPNNLVIGVDTTKDRLKEAIVQAESFADSLVKDFASWSEKMKGSSFVSFLARETVLPWVTMRILNKLEVDKDKCIKCGLCVKECPVHNIRMEEFPIHMNKCEFCMHCGAVCKNKAVHIKGKPSYYIRSASDIEMR